jgi:hypothetical protein
MKAKMMFVVGLAIFASPLARAETLQYWPDESTHKLYVAYRPMVDVEVFNVAADDNYWDEISIEVKYSNPKMEGYLNELKSRYPGYQTAGVVMERSGDFQLSIPVLGVNQTIAAMPGVSGPYMTWQGFVSKAQSQAVRQALAQPGSVSITANTSVSYQMTKVLEHFELGVEVCQKLASADGTIFGAMHGYASVLDDIEHQPISYPSTAARLERSVLESCLMLPSDVSAGSFADVLDAKVALKPNPSRPYGETRGEAPASATVPLQMDIVVNQGGRS